MRFLAWLLPGFVQWRSGRRFAALVLGLAAVLVVAVAGYADLGYLEAYNRLRAPRTVARDLWAEKGEARRTGLAGLAAVIAIGILHGLATRSRGGPGPSPSSPASIPSGQGEAVPV